MSLLVQFYVPGRPRTKGSLKVISVRGRKPIMTEDHTHSKPWRTRMANAVRVAYPEVNRAAHVPYAGAVGIRATFVFERIGPTAQMSPWPTVNSGVNANGDVDKLSRNLLDALKDARLIVDDSQVVMLTAMKTWPTGDMISGVYVEVNRA